MNNQIFGYLLIALGIVIAAAGYWSYRKGGRMKVLSYVVFVIITIGYGCKLAFGEADKPMDIKQAEMPINPHRK